MKKIEYLPLTAIASFLLAYATLCGCLWHLGYWSTFKFNFLEYASFSDLFKSSLYPFLSSFWFPIALSIYAVGFVISITFISRKKKNVAPQETHGTNLPKNFISILLATSSGFILLFSGIFFKSKAMWIILPFAFAIFISCILLLLGFLKQEIKDESLRLIFFFIIFLYPSLNYGIAKKQSNQILNMVKYKGVVDIVSSDTTLKKMLINSAYLGATNNYYLFFVPDRVIVVNSSKIDALVTEEKLDEKNYQRWLND